MIKTEVKRNECFLPVANILPHYIIRTCGVSRPNVVIGAIASDTYAGVRPYTVDLLSYA